MNEWFMMCCSSYGCLRSVQLGIILSELLPNFDANLRGSGI